LIIKLLAPFDQAERVMGFFGSAPFSLAGVSRLATAVALAASLGACAKHSPEITASIPDAPLSEQQWRQQADSLADRYRTEPNNTKAAIAYARALRATGQRAQAVAVLQQASIRNPKDETVLGAYGRALADVGRLDEALAALGKAHTPDRPDWRILNAQGAVLDQMGKHAEAQRYYETALRITPNEPAILSNLGLSYALSKDLARAEETLRRAAADTRAEPKVKQNLGVVLALRSKFDEAERVTAGVLTAEQARSNVAYFRELIREPARGKTNPKTASAS
jgi:Flp pilus assembly protein TadD